MLELTQEEISQTISRAVQIAEQTSGVDSSKHQKHGFEAYVSAAEELGVPREAMLQALREQQHIPIEDFRVGEMVFAPSVDNSSYPATIVAISDSGSASVRFVSGGDQTVPLSDLKPLALVPGCILQFQEEQLGGGIWYSGKLLEYNAERSIAKISYVLDTYTVPLTKIRARKVKKQSSSVPLSVRAILIRTAVATGVGGGILGFLLGYLLHSR